MSKRVRVSSTAAWAVVTTVGVIVLLVVIGLQLFPRLTAGQDVVDGLRPAVQADRVETARGGIDMVSSIVDLADPIVLESGGASGEVAELVAFVASGTGLSEAEVVEALGTSFPHTLGLLTAIPLEAVATEVGGLVTFLSGALGIPEADVLAAVSENFPHLYQAITNLPAVTSGWADVPDTPGTRFDGTDIATVPDVRDYFAQDVVPVLETQDGRLRDIARIPGGVGGLAPLLLVVALVVIAFGAVMMLISRGGGTPRPLAIGGWAIVIVVGLVVELVVLGFQLFPRLSDAHLVLEAAKPAYTDERVATAVGGINIISSAADTVDPLMLASGGAAAEVPALVAFVADGTGLTEEQVVGALGEDFPHVLGLLQALPLEEVNAEVPQLISFLATALGVTEDDVVAALGESFPRLAQSIITLPAVVAGWNEVPNTPGPRYDGSAVDTLPQVRDYFKDDLIPTVGATQADFIELQSTWPPTYFFPPLLTVVGLLVIGYGLAMLIAVARSKPDATVAEIAPTQHPGRERSSRFAAAVPS